MQMVLFIGIQATGKSEFFKQRFYKTHMRLNLDMLRTRHREAIFLQACLQAKQPFVVDNTNPAKDDRQRYIAPAKAAGFAVAGYYFQSGIQQAIARNEGRSGKERLPVQALLSTYGRLELPARDEGFHELYYVSIAPDGTFAVEEYRDEV